MEMTLGAWALAVCGVGCAAYVIRRMVNASRSARFDTGSVSQNWLTEHRTGKGDRFS
jgi:hypothetical protein